MAVFVSSEEPLLLCEAVRSPGQRMSRLFAECERYHDRGVAYCWVIDLDGTAWEYHRSSPYPVPAQNVIGAGEMRIVWRRC